MTRVAHVAKPEYNVVAADPRHGELSLNGDSIQQCVRQLADLGFLNVVRIKRRWTTEWEPVSRRDDSSPVTFEVPA